MTDGTTNAGSTADDASDDAYGGILGAFPYAVRASDSWLFRGYAVAGGLLAALVVVLFALALVVLLGQTANAPGGRLTFSRAFYVFLMLLVVGPLIAPVVLVARRHRRAGSTTRYDRGLAVGGYLFVAGLYLGLVVSTPESQQRTATGVLGPALTALYDLPPAAGAVPPVVAAGLIVVLHRRLR
ncbi:MAG: hypothetical protein ABEJ40_07650 [Haloarculaceae archaeon]